MSIWDEVTKTFSSMLSNRPGMQDPMFHAWSLTSILAEMCDRCGVPYEAVNLERLEGSVDGLVYDPNDPVSDSIEALAQIYSFDPVSFDGKIHFIPRGGNVVREVFEGDLVENRSQVNKRTRKDTLSVPRVLHLEYYDTEGGLDADKQTSDRSLDTRAVAETKVQTPVILRTEDAARAAVIIHKVSIEEQAGDLEIRLPDSFIDLTDSDCILYEGERYRITHTDIEEGFQSYTLRKDRRSAYQSSVIGIPVDPPIDPPSLIVGDTVLHFIDSHILRDSDDRLGYYVAVSRASDNWSGALVELSIDGGETFVDSVDVETETTMGTLLTDLPVGPKYWPDESSVFQVKLALEDPLENMTFRELCNRNNLCLVGNELINFGEPLQLEPLEWELSYLLRGRKGTDVVHHPAGERFILMERQYLFFIEAEVFELGRTLTFRSTSFGSTESHTQSAVFTGMSQRERRVSHLRAHRKDGQVDIDWFGVGRIGGGSNARQGVSFIGFRVTINGSSQMIQDNHLSVSDPGGPVTIRVAQVNSLTGDGPVSEIVI